MLTVLSKTLLSVSCFNVGMNERAVLLIVGTFVMLTVKGHVDLSNPQGGEVYYSGNRVNVSWVEVQAHNTLNWDLLFSRDGGLS